MMYISIVFLLNAIAFTICAAQTEMTTKPPKRGVATITSPQIHRQRQSAGSGRLSLINYRFNRRPKKKHLDARELKMILGTAYDSRYMSMEQPPEISNQAAAAFFDFKKESWRYREMLQELHASNLTQELQRLAGDRFTVEPEYVKTFEKWLLKRASCAVKYAWEDIGALFWPRYIRRGECATQPGTCSWPSGMHCVPSGTTTIEVLRWQCRTPKGKGRKGKNVKVPEIKEYKPEEKPLNMRCGWVRVPYPITSECMCTC